jgi:CRISPR type IV-associated protein Csf3
MQLADISETNKKKAYLKAKNEEFENNSRIKIIRDLYRGIKEFKKGYQPRTNTVKNEKGDLVSDHLQYCG